MTFRTPVLPLKHRIGVTRLPAAPGESIRRRVGRCRCRCLSNKLAINRLFGVVSGICRLSDARPRTQRRCSTMSDAHRRAVPDLLQNGTNGNADRSGIAWSTRRDLRTGWAIKKWRRLASGGRCQHRGLPLIIEPVARVAVQVRLAFTRPTPGHLYREVATVVNNENPPAGNPTGGNLQSCSRPLAAD